MMAGKSVGIDWYQGAYTILEKVEDRLIPVESFSEVYDHLDEVNVSEVISEIATMEASAENRKTFNPL